MRHRAKSPFARCRRVASLVVAAVVAAVLVGGSGVAISTPVSGAARQSGSGSASVAAGPRWAPCTDGGGECATLDVPLTAELSSASSASSRETIPIAVVRIAARRPSARVGVLLVNPGGPGGSGRVFARQIVSRWLPRELRDRFDVIGWDPRGVGISAPIDCLDDAALDAYLHVDGSPDSATERSELINTTKDFVDGCVKKSGPRLFAVSSDDVVRDMDAIREWLGEEKISYMGFSYGSLLGLRYADAYPSRVRSIVVDGILDPAAGVEERVIGQSAGFERQLDAFLKDCTARRCSFVRSGETTNAAFDRVMRQVEERDIAVGTRRLGPNEAWTAVLGSLYGPQGWQQLRQSLTELDEGRGARMLSGFDSYSRRGPDGRYGPLFESNVAVNCADLESDISVADIDALATRASSSSPRFGSYVAYSYLPCAMWRRTGLRTAPRIARAAGAPPIVLIGSRGDPATPYEWAERAASNLSDGRLITHEANSHTALLTGNRCLRRHVVRYLMENVAPARRSVCRGA